MNGQFNQFLIAGMTIVLFAFVSYSTAISFEVKNRKASNALLGFFTAGVILDVSSTVCMILGSRHMAITPHGLLGYSALAGMIIDAVLLWKHRVQKGDNLTLSRPVHLYSRLAYAWWIIAFIAGALLVMIKKA